MKRILATLAIACSFVTGAAASTFGPLVEPQDLSKASSDVVLLDLRGDAYAEGHIDGAVSAPYGLFRGPKENPGQLFDVEALEASLEKLGLEQDQAIVIVSAGENSSDFGAAARVYWSLKSTGFEDLAILNGGHAAWTKAGLPTTTAATTLPASELELTFDPTWYAGTEEVSKIANGESSAVLVDARLTPFFEGEKAHPAAKQPGTLPHAINHSFTNFFEEGQPAISKIGDVKALKATLHAEHGEEVVSFCNTGHWAATHWFAVSELAGVENAKLYPGSMVEYSNAGLPMENTPGLFKNLIKQITQ